MLGNLWAPGGTLTYRRVRILIDRLPPESFTKTAMRENTPAGTLAATGTPGYGPWSHTEMLLARIIDLLAIVEYAVYFSQGGKPKEPAPMPRPGVTDPDAPKVVVPLNNTMLAQLRAMRGE